MPFETAQLLLHFCIIIFIMQYLLAVIHEYVKGEQLVDEVVSQQLPEGLRAICLLRVTEVQPLWSAVNTVLSSWGRGYASPLRREGAGSHGCPHSRYPILGYDSKTSRHG